jgi:archaeosine-15-forming tRNA-guanine transglycosylase
VSFNPAQGKIFVMQLYVMKIVSYMRQVGDATICNEDSQLHAAGRWLSSDTQVADGHDKTEILLKVEFKQPNANH